MIDYLNLDQFYPQYHQVIQGLEDNWLQHLQCKCNQVLNKVWILIGFFKLRIVLACPFVNENLRMKDALKIMSKKKLGVLIVRNKRRSTVGIITDGDVRLLSKKNNNLQSLSVKKVMTKKPITISKEILAA